MKSRREVLGLLGRILVGSGVWACAGWGGIRKAIAGIKKRILPANTDLQRLRTENPAGLDTRNIQVMPLEKFGTMGDDDAAFDPETWRLEVSGAVSSPMKLSYREIRDLPSTEREVLLICPGVFVNHGRWKGVSSKGILEKAKPLPGVSEVVFYGKSRGGERDEKFSLAEFRDEKVFLVYGVNGRDLPRKHGYPLRVVAEGHWGHTWTKFVHRMEFVKSSDRNRAS